MASNNEIVYGKVPETIFNMHPVDSILRLLAIVDSTKEVLRDNGPTPRNELHAKLWEASQYTAMEVDHALCYVKRSVDEEDVWTLREN